MEHDVAFGINVAFISSTVTFGKRKLFSSLSFDPHLYGGIQYSQLQLINYKTSIKRDIIKYSIEG